MVCTLIMMHYIVGLPTSLLLLILPCICPIFFLSILRMMKFSSKISLKLCKLEYSYLVCRLIMMYYVPWDCEPAFSCLFFPVFIYFSFSLHFSSKISSQLYRIETSNLVVKLYRGIENGPSPICSSLILFFFLPLQIFRQIYLYNGLR